MAASSTNTVQTIDSKWRLMIPLKFRSLLTPDCVVYLDEDDYLAMVPSGHWHSILEHMGLQRNAHPDNDALQAAVDRTHNFSEKVTVDGSGRFVLPARLRPECDLKPDKEAVFVGRSDRVTLVSHDTYKNAFEPKLRAEEAKDQQKVLLRSVAPLLDLNV